MSSGIGAAGRAGFRHQKHHNADETPPRANPSQPTVAWDAMLADWLRSGKSKHAYIVAKMGYYGGGSVRKTRDWPRRLIEAIRTEGTNDEDLLRTFVAHFGPAYGGNVSVDALYMSVPDLVPAERSLDPNAPRVPKSVPTPQLPKAKPTPLQTCAR